MFSCCCYIYSKENLLNNVLGAIPSDFSRDECLAALPRALVAGFVKTDKDFKAKGTHEHPRYFLRDMFMFMCWYLIFTNPTILCSSCTFYLATHIKELNWDFWIWIPQMFEKPFDTILDDTHLQIMENKRTVLVCILFFILLCL